jgi:hypothetical protein
MVLVPLFLLLAKALANDTGSNELLLFWIYARAVKNE